MFVRNKVDMVLDVPCNIVIKKNTLFEVAGFDMMMVYVKPSDAIMNKFMAEESPWQPCKRGFGINCDIFNTMFETVSEDDVSMILSSVRQGPGEE